MSVHRSRRRPTRREAAAVTVVQDRQLEVDLNAAELLLLWRALPDATAKDSAGTLNSDRHATGARAGSAATVNVNVLDAATDVEAALYKLGAEAVRVLNLERGFASAAVIIAALPGWHAAAGGGAFGRRVAKEIESGLYALRGALGLRRLDQRLGVDCPDHREKPAPLLMVGDVARMRPSVLAGPPDPIRRTPPGGPRCVDDCTHPSCRAAREWPRLVDAAGAVTDWVYVPAEDDVRWSGRDGDLAWTWERSHAVRCPRCGSRWESTTERRVLARRLAELGDAPADAAALIS